MTDGNGGGGDHVNWLARFFSQLGGVHETPDPANSLWPTSPAPAEQVRQRLSSSEWGPGCDRDLTVGPPRNRTSQFPTGRTGAAGTNRGSYPT